MGVRGATALISCLRDPKTGLRSLCGLSLLVVAAKPPLLRSSSKMAPSLSIFSICWSWSWAVMASMPC